MNISPENTILAGKISDFLIEKVVELWGIQERSWSFHLHPDYDNLASKLLGYLRCEFNPELVTSSTAWLLCYKDQPEELTWWKTSQKWKAREIRARVSFGCWLWQSTNPSDYARDLFMEEFAWESQTPIPDAKNELYFAFDVLSSWLGRVPRQSQYQQPISPVPDSRALDMIESLLRMEIIPWSYNESSSHYARFSIILKNAGRYSMDLCRQVLNRYPQIAIDNDVNNGRALEPYLTEVIYEFAAELTEENSHRFCYFGWPTGARWVIRACENVERLGLTTLVSSPKDAYDLNHAIRKIAAIKAFLPDDDLASFKLQLSSFSPATRRLVAACSPVARNYLLDDPTCVIPPAFDVFKEKFLSYNKALHIYFENSPEPDNGVLPVNEFKPLVAELGETGRKWMLEQFAQQGGQAEQALLLLKGLFGMDREKIEASIARSSQTAVKAYGLLPLPDTEPERTNDLLQRYTRICEYTNEVAKFKAGRRTNSLAAARVGLTNLAQSAGFPSPIAMEIEIMLSSSKTAETLPSIPHDSYDARIILTSTGPEIVVEKLGRPQKSVPAAMKKSNDFVMLKEKLVGIEKQFQHFIEIFEEKMVSQSPIAANDFSKMFTLPVSRWILQRLLLRNGNCIGLIDDGGSSITGSACNQVLDGNVSIIHPVQLPENEVADWKRHFVSQELESPFPQLTRDTYFLRDDEINTNDCKRFAGISVDCSTAIRKLSKLGWTATKVDYPFFYKTFPQHGVRASLLPGDGIRGFDSGDDFLIASFCFSPADSMYFNHSEPITLGKVSPIAFSEVIRDFSLAFGKL